MAREKENYRDNLDRLDTAYPGKELLTYAEIAHYLGVSSRTVMRKFKYDKFSGIPKTTVARSLC